MFARTRRRGHTSRAVDVDRNAIASFNLLYKIKGLVEMIQGVQKNQGWRRGREGGKHVNGNESGEAKGGCLVEVGEVLESPCQNFLGWQG